MILKPVAKIIPKNMTRLNYLTFTDGLLGYWAEFNKDNWDVSAWGPN